jgi:hypothetical protein
MESSGLLTSFCRVLLARRPVLKLALVWLAVFLPLVAYALLRPDNWIGKEYSVRTAIGWTLPAGGLGAGCGTMLVGNLWVLGRVVAGRVSRSLAIVYLLLWAFVAAALTSAVILTGLTVFPRDLLGGEYSYWVWAAALIAILAGVVAVVVFIPLVFLAWWEGGKRPLI